MIDVGAAVVDPELADVVGAPAPHARVGQQRARVTPAGRDPDRVLAQAGHRDRGGLIARAEATELIVIVGPPAPHAAVAVHGTRVRDAGIDRDHVGHARDLHR